MNKLLNNLIFSVLASSVMLLLPVESTAQWTKSSGPHSTACRVLIQKDGIVYAGTYGGVFKSTDTAKTWTAVSTGLTDLEIGALLFKGTTLYAGTGANGLYSSTNGGTSWSKVGTTNFNRVNALATDGTRLYLGAGGGMYVSTDNGITWINPTSLIGEVKNIQIVGTTIYAGTFGNYLYKSTNNGTTWTVIDKLNNGLTSEYVVSLANIGTTVFAGLWSGSRDGGVNRSTDNGQTWTPLTKYPWDVKSMIAHGSTLYATGYYEGVYCSADGGTTWKYAGLRGYPAQTYSAFSMLIVGSKLIVGYDTVLIADTGFVQNFKPAILQRPANTDINIGTQPTFNFTRTTQTSGVGLQYSTSATNWSQAPTVFVSNTSHTLSTPLNHKTKYYWRILEQVWNLVDSTNLLVSSDTFSFTTIAQFALTYPNGGEVLASGDSSDIAWEGVVNNDTLSIYYTTNNIDWQLITGTGVNGKFRWKVPKAESGRCKVRIIGGSGADTSDRFFTISIPKGTASAIDFGQTTVGTSLQKTMLCLSTGLATLRVEEVLFNKNSNFFLKGISRSKDSTFITIEFTATSVGTFGDNVFIITQAGDTILTEVKGTAIAASKITITYPNGNEILTAKDTVTIRWSGVDPADTVRLEYSTDGGTIWHLISDKAKSLKHVWTLPKIESDRCLLRAKYKVISYAGEIDTTFLSGSGFDSRVNCAVKQKDGKVLLGGSFRTYDSHLSQGIVRIHPDGSFDSTFKVQDGFNLLVMTLAVDDIGNIIAGGAFTSYNGIPCNSIARLHSDGSFDTTFQGTGCNAQVNYITIQQDQKIVAVGEFTQYDSLPANRIVRITTDGRTDNTFNTGSGCDNAMDAVQIINTKLYIFGRTDSYNGITGRNTFRLNADGSNDPTFRSKTGFSGWTQYSSLQKDNKILCSGGFDGYDGISSRNIVRMNPDGTIDTSFISRQSQTSNKIYGTTAQNDGKIYASGSFTEYDQVSIASFMRLYPEGELDTDFKIGAGFDAPTLGSVSSNDSSLIVYGDFSKFDGKQHNEIIRLRTITRYASIDTSDALFAISIPKGTSTTLDFGKADTNTNTAKDITLTNTGKVPLALTMIQNTGGNPFSTIDTAKRIIPESKSDNINISFIPTAVQSYVDTMKWITIAGDTIVSTMRGEGIASKPGVTARFDVNAVSLCQFTDTLLTVRVTGGTPPYQFSWTNIDGSDISPVERLQGGGKSDSTIRLSPLNTNIYRVIAIDSKAQTDTAFIDLTVKKRPMPKLLPKGATTLCAGDSVQIEVVNEANYTGAPLWSDGSIGASLWVKSSGVYFCAIDSNGCNGVSDSVTITVNPVPSVTITQVSDELIATTADTYQWLASDGTPIAGATSKTYTPLTEGNYFVRVTANGCSAVSAVFAFKKRQNFSSIIVFELNFGQQVVSNIIGRNAPLRNSVKIFNNGSTDRTIDSIIIQNTVFDLKKNALPRIIPPGAIVSFNTDFTPTAIGLYTDEIVVYAGSEIIRGRITGEGIALPPDGVITEIELVPNKIEVAPGDTLLVFLRIKDEQPQASKATKFIANMQYDSRVLQWLPRSRQFNDEDSKRTNYWSLNVQEKRRFQGNPRLDTLMFLVKLADVDSTSLVFSDSTAFIWTDANGKVFPACRDSIVYIKVCNDGSAKQLIRFAKPDMIKQVAPNPSVSTSTITLSMGIAGQCSVKLIDIFGREIQAVEYDRLPEGDHQLLFDNTQLETGTYYVVMKTGFAVSTQKISIVR